MKLAYIAGPFRAKTEWQKEQNVRRAEELALKVAALGVMPVCPHKNTQHFHGLLSDEFWLEGAMELMRRCDVIVVTDDWEKSEGARKEVDEARRLGKPVLTYAELAEVGATRRKKAKGGK